MNISRDLQLCSVKSKRLHITDDIWLIPDDSCSTIPTSSLRQNSGHGVITLKRCTWVSVVCSKENIVLGSQKSCNCFLFFRVKLRKKPKPSRTPRSLYILTGQMSISAAFFKAPKVSSPTSPRSHRITSVNTYVACWEGKRHQHKHATQVIACTFEESLCKQWVSQYLWKVNFQVTIMLNGGNELSNYFLRGIYPVVPLKALHVENAGNPWFNSGNDENE